jgi:hypothetical protein
MRLHAKWALIPLCLAMAATAAVAQGTAKTEITGTPPFTLGMPKADALHEAPAFQPISAACPLQPYTFDRTLGLHVVTQIDTVNHVDAQNYWARMPAPIGGYPYNALVNLCFYQGKLSAIRIMWNEDAFKSNVLEWWSRAQELAAQLNASYAPNLFTRNSIDYNIGGNVEVRDPQGNTLDMYVQGVSTGFSIILNYIAGPYNHALNGPVGLEGSY